MQFGEVELINAAKFRQEAARNLASKLAGAACRVRSALHKQRPASFGEWPDLLGLKE